MCSDIGQIEDRSHLGESNETVSHNYPGENPPPCIGRRPGRHCGSWHGGRNSWSWPWWWASWSSLRRPCSSAADCAVRVLRERWSRPRSFRRSRRLPAAFASHSGTCATSPWTSARRPAISASHGAPTSVTWRRFLRGSMPTCSACRRSATPAASHPSSGAQPVSGRCGCSSPVVAAASASTWASPGTTTRSSWRGDRWRSPRWPSIRACGRPSPSTCGAAGPAGSTSPLWWSTCRRGWRAFSTGGVRTGLWRDGSMNGWTRSATPI